MKRLGQRIREVRTDHDETQSQLARIIGVHENMIYRYENGLAELSAIKLCAICLHYKVSADYLLGLPKDCTKPR